MNETVDVSGWEEGLFKIAQVGRDPAWVNGLKHPNGLGIHRQGEDRWVLIHLATGFGVVGLRGLNMLEAMVIASEVATAGDWKFESLSGWQNRDPQLGSKVQVLVRLYEPCVIVDESTPEPIGHQLAMAERVRSTRLN